MRKAAVALIIAILTALLYEAYMYLSQQGVGNLFVIFSLIFIPPVLLTAIISKRRQEGRLLPLLFLLPILELIVLSWIGPVILTSYLAFTDLSLRNFFKFIKDFSGVKITLENFEKIFFAKDPQIVNVLRTTIIFLVGTLSINAFYSLLLSIAIAYFVKSEKLSMFLRMTWLIPRIMPGIIYALLWIWFVDPDYGMLNKLLGLVLPHNMLPQSWILEQPYSQILMILINGYVGASFGMIIYTAAIKSIPPDLINAALVDGANDFQIARRIILPLLKWPMLFVVAWQTLSLLASYEYILMVWGSGSDLASAIGTAQAAGVLVWSLYSYGQAFAMFQYGYASALALVLVIVGIALILVYFKVFGFRRMMEQGRVET